MLWRDCSNGIINIKGKDIYMSWYYKSKLYVKASKFDISYLESTDWISQLSSNFGSDNRLVLGSTGCENNNSNNKDYKLYIRVSNENNLWVFHIKIKKFIVRNILKDFK